MTYNIPAECNTSYHHSLMAQAELNRRMKIARSVLKNEDVKEIDSRNPPLK